MRSNCSQRTLSSTQCGSEASRYSSQSAVRKHRKKVARIVCTQWLFFASKRLTSYRHRRRCLLLYGMLAFKTALSRQHRLGAAVNCMATRRKFLVLISGFARWQQFSKWQAELSRKTRSLSTAFIAQLKGRLVTQWCAHMGEMQWLAVCEAKATFFSRFMRMSSAVRALNRHRLRRHEKRVSSGAAVRHDSQRFKRRAWKAWTWAVCLQQQKQARYRTAEHFARHRRLRTVLAELLCYCQSRKTARSALAACLRSAAASIQHHAVRCALRDWLGLAHLGRVLSPSAATLQHFSRSLAMRSGVSTYVPARLDICSPSLTRTWLAAMLQSRERAGGRLLLCKPDNARLCCVTCLLCRFASCCDGTSFNGNGTCVPA